VEYNAFGGLVKEVEDVLSAKKLGVEEIEGVAMSDVEPNLGLDVVSDGLVTHQQQLDEGCNQHDFHTDVGLGGVGGPQEKEWDGTPHWRKL